MTDFLRRSWAVVRLDNVVYNIDKIRQKIPKGCMLLGVVKADAYGHGDKYIAEEMVRHGVDWFGVSNINEALNLRKHKIFRPILIFGATPNEMAAELCENNITQAIYSLEYALQLQKSAEEQGVTVDAHIKIDTGMGRIGFSCDDMEQIADEIERVYYLPNIRVTGIFTHFSCSDETEQSSISYTKEQYRKFSEICDILKLRGVDIKIRHCANSGATIMYPEMCLDMVRPGILPYGLYPSNECRDIDLRPVMELYSVVTMVKKIKSDTQVSYGRTYKADGEKVIATVPIGYADGYSRLLSNKGRCIINGEYANIVGRVCMDQMMVDVTNIPDVGYGTQVTLVGKQGDKEITFDEIAELSQTVNYESVCLIGKRIPRIYKKYGETIGVVDYTGLNL
ncbi:MAG: alanine racemase [Oscillospiraceae bacterium]